MHHSFRRVRRLWALVFTLIAGGAPAADLVVTATTRTPAGVRLEWNTAAGRQYAVVAAPAVTGPWTERIRALVGTPTLSWTDETAGDGETARFFRIVETPIPADPGADVLLQRADAVPYTAAAVVVNHMNLCASAIYVASGLRGVLTTNGTLREVAGNWSYDPAPADRLAVRFASGTNVTYRTRTLLGNFNGDVSTFLGNGHDFAFVAGVEGAADLEIHSQRPNGSCSIQPVVTAVGGILYSNVAYTVDLRTSGPYCFDVDSTGFSLLEDYRMTGTVDAVNFHLTVDHRRRYENVGSNPDSASTEQIWIAHRLTTGADTFVWQGVTRKKSFRAGKISDWRPPGYWSAEGVVLRNGVPYGTYEYIPGTEAPFGFLRFIIRVGDRVIELERWI